MAMIISSAGGVVLERFVETYSNFSLFDPVINGVGGNIAAVHAARLSTSLHLTYANEPECQGVIARFTACLTLRTWRVDLH
jgi:cation transporter-like permease